MTVSGAEAEAETEGCIGGALVAGIVVETEGRRLLLLVEEVKVLFVGEIDI